MNSNKVDPTPIAVIGAGLGGLAAANVLAARGHKVILFERNSWLGGKAAVFEEGGYRFDMGPTILTVPSVLKKIFSEAGKNMGDYLKLVALDPQWRCFFDAEKQSGKQEQPASTLDLHANIVAMQEILRRFSPDSGTADGYREFMKLAERLNDISSRFFFWKSVGSMMDVFDLRASLSTKVLKDVMSMRLGSTVHKTVRSFIKDERVAQMIDHFTQYVGSAPDASPAVLCSIAHMQTNEGIWYPMGGTGAIPKALECLAREQGVEIRTSSKIHRLLFKAGRVVAIETDKNEQIIVKSVVSNCDSVRTYRDLIGGDVNEAFQTERRYEPACSGVVLYLGLDRQYDQLLHHNFVFSENAEEEFDYIYRVGEPAPDPTCYVCAPASTESGVAPKGGEALYVLVHTPYLRPHHHWQEMFPKYRQVILKKLEKTAGLKDLQSHIVVERALTPMDIHNRYNVLNGAIYGLASHGSFMGAFKPANRRKDLPGLYLAGGSAHPGPGMPMVLMSGWIAADACHQDQVS